MANPLVPQMTEVSRQILGGEVQMEGYFSKLVDGDTPYSVEKGPWAIIEDAIHRRGSSATWKGHLTAWSSPGMTRRIDTSRIAQL